MSDKAEIELDYKKRINRVFKYIDENLSSDLSLSVVAQIALFSPFHFHRIFKLMTNETLNEYVRRRRIEKAALDILHTKRSITGIAHLYGFGDHSSFSRAFKKFYGVSPKEFKQENPNRHSKIRQLESKKGQEYPDLEKYICIIDNLKNWRAMNAKIEVKDVDRLNAAGIAHIGVEGIQDTFEKLIKWANSKHLLENPKAKMGRLFYDSFKVTASDKVRMSIFLVMNENFEPDSEVNKICISNGKCIIGRFEITPLEFEKSWTAMFMWMNEQGYKKGTNNPYEIYHNDYREHPENKFIVDLCIPIE